MKIETWKCASNIWSFMRLHDRQKKLRNTDLTPWLVDSSRLVDSHLRKHRNRRGSRHTRRNWTSLPRVAPRAPSVPWGLRGLRASASASASPQPWAEDSPKLPRGLWKDKSPSHQRHDFSTLIKTLVNKFSDFCGFCGWVACSATNTNPKHLNSAPNPTNSTTNPRDRRVSGPSGRRRIACRRKVRIS